MQLTPRRAALIAAGVITFTLGTGIFIGVEIAAATKPNPEHKVTICHRTASRTNPYVVETVDVASILKKSGHNGHTGPVFNASLPKNTKWGDIIPAFNFGPGEVYAGMNLGSVGLIANGCHVPTPTTTTTTAPPPPPPSSTTTTLATTTTTTLATTTTTVAPPPPPSSTTTTTKATTTTTKTTPGIIVTTTTLPPHPATLPVTGSYDGLLAAVAAGLILSGASMVLVARKKAVQ